MAYLLQYLLALSIVTGLFAFSSDSQKISKLWEMSVTDTTFYEISDTIVDEPFICTFIDREPCIDYKEMNKRVEYPRVAKELGLEGKVTLRILVAQDGFPQKYIIEYSTDSMFNEPAIRAVMQSCFVPAVLNNQPIRCWITIPILFRLR
jgi:TonB family protein